MMLKFQLVKFSCLVSGLFYMTVILRMISFGYDYHWAHQGSHFDQKVFILL